MPKPISDRIAEIKAKKDKLAARLNQLEAKAKTEDRKRDTRRKIIVGGAILAALEKEPLLASRVRSILNSYVGRPVDREVVADLLLPPPLSASMSAAAHATAPPFSTGTGQS